MSKNLSKCLMVILLQSVWAGGSGKVCSCTREEFEELIGSLCLSDNDNNQNVQIRSCELAGGTSQVGKVARSTSLRPEDASGHKVCQSAGLRNQGSNTLSGQRVVKSVELMGTDKNANIHDTQGSRRAAKSCELRGGSMHGCIQLADHRRSGNVRSRDDQNFIKSQTSVSHKTSNNSGAKAQQNRSANSRDKVETAQRSVNDFSNQENVQAGLSDGLKKTVQSGQDSVHFSSKAECAVLDNVRSLAQNSSSYRDQPSSVGVARSFDDGHAQSVQQDRADSIRYDVATNNSTFRQVSVDTVVPVGVSAIMSDAMSSVLPPNYANTHQYIDACRSDFACDPHRRAGCEDMTTDYVSLNDVCAGLLFQFHLHTYKHEPIFFEFGGSVCADLNGVFFVKLSSDIFDCLNVGVQYDIIENKGFCIKDWSRMRGSFLFILNNIFDRYVPFYIKVGGEVSLHREVYFRFVLGYITGSIKLGKF